MLGKMRHRITLQSRTRTADEGGGAASLFVDVEEVWAYFRPVSGQEQFQADKIKEKKKYLATVRYRDSITASQRIKFGDRLYNITSIKNLEERDRYVEIECEEGGAI